MLLIQFFLPVIWYKLSINKTGIYKTDISFLNGLGINTSNLASGPGE